ncbi:Kinesin-1 heavy chain like [Actinidia chinensis var. chinensis]|uniref:Kinesin-1 heavy chain like n=1 Tax=Actinidia chinensis var. chinensis TaxID=1590841 RepID=A0A2R6QWT3_ACTCC|nr:Kinesin-1 heavy chain like [Actinidia chinensis var. chinensis]
MNENNARLIQHLTKNNPPPPAAPIPEVERSLNSNNRAMMSLKVTGVLIEHEIGDVNHPVRAVGEKKVQCHQNLGHLAGLLKQSNVQGFLCYPKKGSARSWFRKLSPRTIDSFGDLSRLVVANFMSCRVKQQKASHLFTIHQKETKSLKDYVKRFNQAVLEVEDPSNKAEKYIVAEELVKAKQRRRGRDDHKIKELDTRRSDYREEVKNKRSDRDSREEVKNKRFDWDSRRTNDKRPCIPPRRPELRILIDNGRSADILFISAFDKMKIGLDKLYLLHTSLLEFGGNTTYPLEWIKLPVTLGTESYPTTVW